MIIMLTLTDGQGNRRLFVILILLRRLLSIMAYSFRREVLVLMNGRLSGVILFRRSCLSGRSFLIRRWQIGLIFRRGVSGVITFGPLLTPKGVNFRVLRLRLTTKFRVTVLLLNLAFLLILVVSFRWRRRLNFSRLIKKRVAAF